MESPSKCCMFFDLTYIDTFMIKCRQSLTCTLPAFVDFLNKPTVLFYVLNLKTNAKFQLQTLK